MTNDELILKLVEGIKYKIELETENKALKRENAYLKTLVENYLIPSIPKEGTYDKGEMPPAPDLPPINILG